MGGVGGVMDVGVSVGVILTLGMIISLPQNPRAYLHLTPASLKNTFEHF